MRVFCYHDNLERPRLAKDTVELTKLGIPIREEKKWEPGNWAGMNNLLFSCSSATLPDLQTEPIVLNSMHSGCDGWTSIHASALTWKAHPLLV